MLKMETFALKRDRQYNLRINGELLEQFQKVAEANGVSIADWFTKLAEQTVLLGESPLRDTDELKTERAVEEFRDKIYEGLLDMREGRHITHEEMLERVAQW